MTMASTPVEGVDAPPLLIEDGERWQLAALASSEIEEFDLRDLSAPVANTCAALRLCLVEGDLEAATRVFPMLVGQVADLRAMAGQLLQPLFADALLDAVSPAHASLFVDTARDLLDAIAAQRERTTTPQVWLHATGGTLEPLLLRLVRLLLDELGVPSRVVGEHRAHAKGSSSLHKLPLRRGQAMCLALPDADSVIDARPLVEWLGRRQVAVVAIGGAVREAPDLVAELGMSASSWSVTAAVDDMLWVRGPLTAAESMALRMAADGYTNVRIAHELGISVSAVKARLESSYQRLHAADRAHAVAIALRNRWIR
jgi:DNA-binding CsgD family transcriptional regulator